jgi:hypothetical protein
MIMIEISNATFIATLCLDSIIMMLVTRLWIWATNKRKEKVYHGVIIVNKDEHGELTESVHMKFYVSPLDYKQGDILQFMIHENHVSSVEEGSEEEKDD